MKTELMLTTRPLRHVFLLVTMNLRNFAPLQQNAVPSGEASQILLFL